MEILTLDFETYYDKEYSLSKLTYEEYIRSKQFQVILLGILFPDGTKEIVHGTRSQMRKYLSDLDWSKYAVLCHNTMFDGAILGWHFGYKPKLWLDTLSMARAMFGNKGNSLATLARKFGLKDKGDEVMMALGKRYNDFTPAEFTAYGNYCLNDCEITRNLFQILYEGWYDLTSCDHRGKWQQSELKLIDYTLRMFTEPVFHLDVDGLQGHLARVRNAKTGLLASCGVAQEDLTSNPKFAKVLESLGVVPPMKLNAKNKSTYAFAKTDQGLKDLVEHENPLVQAVVAARLGTRSTLEETRTERFIDIASRGLFPVPLKYSAARTHRWGGCLVADTRVWVYDPYQDDAVEKRIVDVMPEDLVWDGEEFVSHSGVSFNGYAEVIEYDGVKGTTDHVVFTEAGERSLLAAMQGGNRIEAPRQFSAIELDAARKFSRKH